jgi:hypothetical protein
MSTLKQPARELCILIARNTGVKEVSADEHASVMELLRYPWPEKANDWLGPVPDSIVQENYDDAVKYIRWSKPTSISATVDALMKAHDFDGIFDQPWRGKVNA